MTVSKPLSPHRDHDHNACLAAALDKARRRCVAEGIRWTRLREKVFLELAVSHKPVSAYELIDRLAAKGQRLSPVSVYRILDVLQQVGLAHRIQTRNAFFACLTEHAEIAQAVTVVCDRCDTVPQAARADHG